MNAVEKKIEGLNDQQKSEAILEVCRLVERLNIATLGVNVDNPENNNNKTELPPYAMSEEQRKKRIYRRNNELPDPNAPPGAAINRTKKQITFRFTEQAIDKINAQAKAQGVTRQEWLDAILAPHLEP